MKHLTNNSKKKHKRQCLVQITEINQILEYIKHIQCVNDVAGYIALETDSEQIKALKKHHRVFGTDKRVFEYKAIIISLYGILEKYIELWIKEYLDILSDIVPESR